MNAKALTFCMFLCFLRLRSRGFFLVKVLERKGDLIPQSIALLILGNTSSISRVSGVVEVK